MLITSFSDESLSFLVLSRVSLLIEECAFSQYDTTSRLFDIASIWKAVAKLVSGPPDRVDWENLDFLFAQWLRCFEGRIELREYEILDRCDDKGSSPAQATCTAALDYR